MSVCKVGGRPLKKEQAISLLLLRFTIWSVTLLTLFWLVASVVRHLSLFSAGDNEMISAKRTLVGKNPQRGRANNSVVLCATWSQKSSLKTMVPCKASGAGEPGFYFQMIRTGVPILAVRLPFDPISSVILQKSMPLMSIARRNQCKSPRRIVHWHLQASYTDFHYLRDVWRRTTEKDALVGVSMTGIASGNVLKLI